MKTCPKCKKENTAERKFCVHCGTPLTYESRTNNVQKPVYESKQSMEGPLSDSANKKSKKGIIIAIVSVLAVALVVCAIIFVPKFINNEEETTKEKETKFSQSAVNDDAGENKQESKYLMTKAISYNEDNSSVGWYEYEYDTKGNMTKETLYTANNTVDQIVEYKYDAKGNMTESIVYLNSVNGYFVRDKETYSYDTQGNLIKVNYYDVDSNLYGWDEAEYDAKGNRISCDKYDVESDTHQLYEFEYDAKGNVIKETCYDYDGNVYVREYEYTYDAEGNVTKEICYDADSVIENSFKNEYDANGNMIKRTQYDSEGNEIIHTVYEYTLVK